jgi:hypothetical protein
MAILSFNAYAENEYPIALNFGNSYYLIYWNGAENWNFYQQLSFDARYNLTGVRFGSEGLLNLCEDGETITATIQGADQNGMPDGNIFASGSVAVADVNYSISPSAPNNYLRFDTPYFVEDSKDYWLVFELTDTTQGTECGIYMTYSMSDEYPIAQCYHSEGGTDLYTCDDGNDFPTYEASDLQANLTYTDYCDPLWNCSLFAECSVNISECLAVNDLNVCGGLYQGNLSDYDEPCEMPPENETGYVPNFITGDLTGLTLDTMGSGLLVVLSMIGLVVMVNVVIYLFNKIRGEIK